MASLKEEFNAVRTEFPAGSPYYWNNLGRFLARLAAQGYTLAEVGTAVGLSRERIRQLAVKTNVPFATLGRATRRRSREAAVQAHRDAYRARMRAYRKRRRLEMIRTLQRLGTKFGRTPTLAELAEALNMDIPGLAYLWRARGTDATYRQAFRRLYYWAGYETLPPGTQGHRPGCRCRWHGGPALESMEAVLAALEKTDAEWISVRQLGELTDISGNTIFHWLREGRDVETDGVRVGVSHHNGKSPCWQWRRSFLKEFFLKLKETASC